MIGIVLLYPFNMFELSAVDSAVAYVARGTYRESHACNQSQLYPYCSLSEL